MAFFHVFAKRRDLHGTYSAHLNFLPQSVTQMVIGLLAGDGSSFFSQRFGCSPLKVLRREAEYLVLRELPQSPLLQLLATY